nr:D-alanyl-D-alanine carboxypeptidase family protein [Maliibacterium massiliense]
MKSRILRRFVAMLLLGALAVAPAAHAAPEAADAAPMNITSKAGILVEASTGTVLMESNPDTELPIASLTKMMTLLLSFEAIDRGELRLEDAVTVSGNAAGIEGSKAYLDNGATYTVDALLRSMVVASANDSSIAMAEKLAGSEEVFATRMNERAKELGMNNTQYANCTGLPAPGHHSTARDMSVLSRELIKHPQYFKYSTIWIDEFKHPSGRVTMLTNTNKLIRSGKGVDGIKTGSTGEAGYCLCSTAQREDMRLVAVVLGGPSSKDRFNDASAMLEYGFANYQIGRVVEPGDAAPVPVRVKGGKAPSIALVAQHSFEMVLPRGQEVTFEHETQVPEQVEAPIAKGQEIGQWIIKKDGQEVARIPLLAQDTVLEATYADYIQKIFRRWMGNPDQAA